MGEMLKHLHSGLRWVALVALVIAVAHSIMVLSRKEGEFKRMVFSTAVYALHLQLLIGLVLLLISPKVQFIEGFMKDGVLRFYAIEHPLMMIIGIVLVTIGHAKAKRATDAVAMAKSVLVYYGIGLFLILLRIPWPWQNYGAGWG